MENNSMWGRDTIIVNGRRLNEEQTTVLIEAINGNLQFGTQCAGFLEDSCSLSESEQARVIEEIDSMFIR